jgi:hypothetical protein
VSATNCLVNVSLCAASGSVDRFLEASPENVWALLHHALAATLMERLPEGLVERLCRIRDAPFGQTHPDHIRTGNFTFFQSVREAVPHSTVSLVATAEA